ncbi:MAG: hypothetical protein GX621_19235, partial [Pirellulaceae bacterium]|nr:hypothetical protein [Pirellulaceae bacterium]
MKRRLTIVLLFALPLILSTPVVAGAPATDEPKPNAAARPEPRADRPGWKARHERMNARVNKGN